jgi:circadian clock protein KaiC
MPDQAAEGLKRVSTGQAELDEILNGGFPAHSINIIMGSPGTGKTILAQQTLFHNAGDRPVVFMSTLSEPLSKVVTYLQRFSFYDESLMMNGVIYEDLGPELLEHGVERLVDRIGDVIRNIGPSILVIDSFKAVHDLTRNPLEMRRVAAGLGGLLAAYDVTTFLVGEYTTDAVGEFPEFAVADGIIQLGRIVSGKRDDRHLRVLKLRGSTYHEGSHAFSISEDGLRVFPRLVTPVVPGGYEDEPERIGTGTPGLDQLLNGGIWRASSLLVLGPAGSGKTTLGLGFVAEGAAVGEPSLYVNFQENPIQLSRTVRSLGIELARYEGKNLFFQYESPVEMQIDAVVVELFRMVEERGIRRVVLDALGDLALAAITTERFHDYLYSVVQRFASEGVTSLLTLEGHHGVEHARTTGLARYSTLSDAMVELDVRYDAVPPHRTIRVVKARGIGHPLEAVPMVIEAGGIRLDDPEHRG